MFCFNGPAETRRRGENLYQSPRVPASRRPGRFDESCSCACVRRPGGFWIGRRRAAAGPLATPSVKIAASGLNYLDVQYRMGRLKVPAMPFIYRGRGIRRRDRYLERASPKSTSAIASAMPWRWGRMPGTPSCPHGNSCSLPVGSSTCRQGAGVMLQGLTAHYLTHSTFALKAGDTALCTRGRGRRRVGRGRRWRVSSAPVSSPPRARRRRPSWRRRLVRTTSSSIRSRTSRPRCRRLTDGRGVDVVYDSVGKDTFDRSLKPASTRNAGAVRILERYGAAFRPGDTRGMQRTYSS